MNKAIETFYLPTREWARRRRSKLGGGQKKVFFAYVNKFGFQNSASPRALALVPGQGNLGPTPWETVGWLEPQVLRWSLYGLPGNKEPKHLGRCGEKALCLEEAQMGKEMVGHGKKLVPTDVLSRMSPPRCAASIIRYNRFRLSMALGRDASGSRCKHVASITFFRGEN